MELAPCHPSRAWNFEAAPIFVQNLLSPDVGCEANEHHIISSYGKHFKAVFLNLCETAAR